MKSKVLVMHSFDLTLVVRVRLLNFIKQFLHWPSLAGSLTQHWMCARVHELRHERLKCISVTAVLLILILASSPGFV